MNYADPSGESIILSLAVVGAIILGAAGATAGGIAAYNIAKSHGAEGWDLFGWTTLGVAGGGLIGAAIGYGLGAGISAMTGVAGIELSRQGINLIFVDKTQYFYHVTSYENAKNIVDTNKIRRGEGKFPYMLNFHPT